jgi:hypothetical protein
MNQLLEAKATRLEVKTSSEDGSGKASELMEHHEAIEMMASERYLLDELTPELRDAYEEHMFGCTECASDARFGAAFVDHAKAVLPNLLPAQVPAPVRQPIRAVAEEDRRDWFAWLRPAFVAPAFACLLAIVAYQNLVVYPALQASAIEPRLLPPATLLQGDVRGGVPVVHADLITGSTVSVPLAQSGCQNAACGSYRFDFYDSKGKLIWSNSVTGAAASEDTATVWIPGRVKEDSYKLMVTGVTLDGRSLAPQQHIFELRVKK